MRKLDLNLKKKLHSKAGETIAETLVTMIILSLAVLMLTIQTLPFRQELRYQQGLRRRK